MQGSVGWEEGGGVGHQPRHLTAFSRAVSAADLGARSSTVAPVSQSPLAIGSPKRRTFHSVPPDTALSFDPLGKCQLWLPGLVTETSGTVLRAQGAWHVGQDGSSPPVSGSVLVALKTQMRAASHACPRRPQTPWCPCSCQKRNTAPPVSSCAGNAEGDTAPHPPSHHTRLENVAFPYVHNPAFTALRCPWLLLPDSGRTLVVAVPDTLLV